MKQILFPAYLLTLSILLACCNNSAPNQPSQVPVTMKMDDDTLAMTDTMPVKDADVLTEEQELQLFKDLMDGLKPRKLYDFSMLTPQNLSSVYTNFESVLSKAKDSLNDTEVEFYKDLFARLEAEKQKMEEAQSLDVKLRLKIARSESHIESFFANRISGQQGNKQ